MNSNIQLSRKLTCIGFALIVLQTSLLNLEHVLVFSDFDQRLLSPSMCLHLHDGMGCYDKIIDN